MEDEVAEDDEPNKGSQAERNKVDSRSLHTNVELWTEEINVEPQDSISNVKSNTSGRSKSYVSKSSKSSTSSARRQAEAEQAALMARAAALEKKHALEEHAEQLRRKQEQLEIETQLAAAAAKLAVLSSSLQSSVASKHSEHSDGMASYLKLNPHSAIFVPKANLEVAPKQQASVNTQAHHTNINLSAQATPPQGNEALYSLLHKQNEVIELLVRTQSFQFLPHREVPTFNGDPLQFRAFMSAFEQCVETKMQKRDCIIWNNSLGGQPRELVRSCQHLPSDRAYDVAKDLLTKHFGNELKITAAYVNKLTEWPTVKAEDKKGLQAYALCLAECCNAMQELRYLDELNIPANMKIIIQKLPYKLREKWRVKACDIFETHGRRAGFKDIINFVEYQVKIVSDPTFGDIQDTPVIAKGGNKAQLQQRSQFKRNSFATAVFMSNEPAASVNKKNIQTQTQSQNGSPTTSNFSCLYCSHGHTLDQCSQLKRKSQHEKLDFLKKKGVCFGCLRTGHMSKDCSKRISCKACNQTHPSILHIEKKEKGKEEDRPKEQSVSGTAISRCGHTGAGGSNGILSILPVNVKCTKGNKVIQTYAFLDPESTDTFCSESLKEKLNIKGKRTSMLHGRGFGNFWSH